MVRGNNRGNSVHVELSMAMGDSAPTCVAREKLGCADKDIEDPSWRWSCWTSPCWECLLCWLVGEAQTYCSQHQIDDNDDTIQGRLLCNSRTATVKAMSYNIATL